MRKDLNQLKRVIWFITIKMVEKQIIARENYKSNFQKYKKELIKDTKLYIAKTIIQSKEGKIIEEGLALFEHNFGAISSLIDQCHNFSNELIYPLDDNDVVKGHLG